MHFLIRFFLCVFQSSLNTIANSSRRHYAQHICISFSFVQKAKNLGDYTRFKFILSFKNTV